jgi:hypothetical protein
MLVLAGDPPTQERRNLWNTTVSRSFDEVDGHRRLLDLFNQIRAAEIGGLPVQKVYLGDDRKVIRIINKIVRGLSHHHKFRTAVPDEQVRVSIMPPSLISKVSSDMEYSHRDPSIVEYWYAQLNSDGIDSGWLFRFFQTIAFVGVVIPG